MFKWIAKLLGMGQKEPTSAVKPTSEQPERPLDIKPPLLAEKRPVAHTPVQQPSKPAAAPKPEQATPKAVQAPAPLEIIIEQPRDRNALATVQLILKGRKKDVLPANTRADDRLATAKGNPDRNPTRRFGDVPFGIYEIIGWSRARDQKSVEIFGRHGAFVLRPLSGQAAVADSNGRTAVLLHSGPDVRRPTDGSIRVPESVMDLLASTVPENPASAKPRIKVRVIEATAAANVEAKPTATSKPASRVHSTSTHSSYTSSSHSSRSYDSYDYGYDWWTVYNMLYIQDMLLDDSPGFPGHHWDEPMADENVPEPYTEVVPLEPETNPDSAAQQALESLGVAVLPDGDASPAEAQPQAPAQPISDVSAPDHAPAAPAPEPVYTAPEASYTPSGGAYDR